MANTLYFSHRDNRANVYELQTYLRYISRFIKTIPLVNPDGIYGPKTTEAVSEFQKKFGLPVTGEADFETWTRIVEVYDEFVRTERELRPVFVYPTDLPGFKEGDRFDEIYVLQVILRRLGRIFGNVHTAKITGVYDADTKRAVDDLAKRYNRDSKNGVDRELWNLFADIYSGFTYND